MEGRGPLRRVADDVCGEGMLLSWIKASASIFLPSCIGYCLEESPCSLRLGRPQTPLCHPDAWCHLGVDIHEGPLLEKKTFLSSWCLQNSEIWGLKIGGRHSSLCWEMNVYCIMQYIMVLYRMGVHSTKKEEYKKFDSYLGKLIITGKDGM